jgi:hypothetical protein
MRSLSALKRKQETVMTAVLGNQTEIFDREQQFNQEILASNKGQQCQATENSQRFLTENKELIDDLRTRSKPLLKLIRSLALDSKFTNHTIALRLLDLYDLVEKSYNEFIRIREKKLSFRRQTEMYTRVQSFDERAPEVRTFSIVTTLCSSSHFVWTVDPSTVTLTKFLDLN